MLENELRPKPQWAQVLAPSLPETTKKMWELDHAQRQQNPLGYRLAAQIRLAVADAMRCRTAIEMAQRDGALVEGAADDGLREELAAWFARRLTIAASEITDDEFQPVLETFGIEQTVAIVHTIAYANFQNRLFLALEIDRSGQLLVGDVGATSIRSDSASKMPMRLDWHSIRDMRFEPLSIERPQWSGQSFSAIVRRRDSQRARLPRIPLPPDDLIERLPEPARSRARRVAWTAISMGYQPQLTSPWLDAMRTFQAEAQLDPVFANSIFWVVTRTNECFY